MARYRRKPLESILNPPSDRTYYLLIQNQYWALDDEDNVFFIGLRPICGANRKTVHFYIERLELPLSTIYAYGHLKSYNKTYRMIKLEKAWIRKAVGHSIRRN